MQSNSISPYLINPNEAYSIALPFDDVVDLVKYLAAEHDYSTSEDILVIELTEGVFIRTANPDWCDTLTEWVEEKNTELPIKIIGLKKWTDLTRKYRSPIQSFGDYKLAMWRVGF